MRRELPRNITQLKSMKEQLTLSVEAAGASKENVKLKLKSGGRVSFSTISTDSGNIGGTEINGTSFKAVADPDPVFLGQPDPDSNDPVNMGPDLQH